MRRLTPQQYHVYQQIASYIEQHGYSPLPSDIATALQLDLQTVKRTIWMLRDRGHITYLTNTSRMIYLTASIPQVEQAPSEKEKAGRQKRKRGPRGRYNRGDHRRSIYTYIGNYAEKHRYPPVIREIATALNIGTTTVKTYVDLLRDQGYLTYQPGLSRSITLTDKPFDTEDALADTAMDRTG